MSDQLIENVVRALVDELARKKAPAPELELELEIRVGTLLLHARNRTRPSFCPGVPATKFETVLQALETSPEWTELPMVRSSQVCHPGGMREENGKWMRKTKIAVMDESIASGSALRVALSREAAVADSPPPASSSVPFRREKIRRSFLRGQWRADLTIVSGSGMGAQCTYEVELELEDQAALSLDALSGQEDARAVLTGVVRDGVMLAVELDATPRCA